MIKITQVSFLLSALFLSLSASGCAQPPVQPSPSSTSGIRFDRQEMSRLQGNPEFRAEGYWASFEGQDSPYPWPVPSKEAWPHKEEFVSRLMKLEELLRGTDSYLCYRGLSHSRIDDSFVGNCEFKDSEAKVIWPDGYRTHYVEEHNVMPSREFYDYVMSASPRE